MRVLLVFLVIAMSGWAQSQIEPQALPTCRQAWSGRNALRYNFEEDTRTAQETFGENLLGNFGYENYVEVQSFHRKDCQKELTILVFMAASNDLSPYAFWDLTEMESGYAQADRAGSSLSTDLLVDIQSLENEDLRRLHLFQTERVFNKELGLDHYESLSFSDIKSPVAKYDPQRAGSVEEQLFDFIQWGITEYPSEHYMLVVWGHGQGFTSELRDIAPGTDLFSGRFGGLAFEEGSSDYLTTPALARVLRRTKEEVFDGKDQIDIYASDACLMQMLEVAYEVAPYTNYIVGSAQIQSYLGMPYRTMMYEINSGRFGQNPQQREEACGQSADPYSCHIAHMIPELTRRTVNVRQGLQGSGDPTAFKRFTISALSSQALVTSLAPWMNRFAGRMIDFLEFTDGAQREELRRSLNKSLRFMGDSVEASAAMIFLVKYLDGIMDSSSEGTELYQKAKALRLTARTMLRNIDHIAVASRNGEFYDLYLKLGGRDLGVEQLSNLALWIPETELALEERIADFNNSALYQSLETAPGGSTTTWEQWLRLLHQDQ